MPIPVIDSLSYIPTREVLLDIVTAMPPQLVPYIKKVFGSRIAPLIGIDGDELFTLKEELSPDKLEEYLAPRIEKLTLEPDAFIETMRGQGIERIVLFTMDEESVTGLRGLPNDYYGELARAFPGFITALAGVDPLRGIKAVRELDRSYRLGLRGAALRPFIYGIPPSHRKMYPVYAKCVELDIPVWIHCSVNYSTNTMEVERPRYLDIVAQDFPELKIIAGHGGWPWIGEILAVAMRNEHVYIDIASYLPRYFTRPGSGWEMLLNYGNSLLADRILFASTWLFMGCGIRELADEVAALPLSEGVKRKWLSENARRLFCPS